MVKDNKNIHKLTKVSGHSYYIIIPAEEICSLGWKERQKLIVKRRGKKIIIEDWKK